jgi:hypothetical protein
MRDYSRDALIRTITLKNQNSSSLWCRLISQLVMGQYLAKFITGLFTIPGYGAKISITRHYAIFLSACCAIL